MEIGTVRWVYVARKKDFTFLTFITITDTCYKGEKDTNQQAVTQYNTDIVEHGIKDSQR